MNPMEWLKVAYETFGAKHPTASLIVVMALGALIFGAVWVVGAQQYEKSHNALNAPAVPNVSPPATNITSGPQSPIMPNNSGTVTITNEETKPNYSPPKEQSK